MVRFKTKIGNPLMLGATKLLKGANFALVVENASSCPVLRIYEKGTYNVVCDLSFDVSMQFGDVFAMELDKFDADKYDYGYIYAGRPYRDAYAKIINHRENWGKKSLPTYSVKDTSFEGKKECRRGIPYDEAVIYRLHVRGFTAHKSSGTSHKGTFKGVADKLQYLSELGINTIELMPSYDFDEVSPELEVEGKTDCHADKEDKVNYWGYTTAHYFAPKSSFAMNGGVGACTEFEEMVRIIHNANMDVIMDFYFKEDTKPYVVLDCLRYWVLEYHIDGVRVNLSAIPVDMLKADPILSKIKIVGDSWQLAEKQGVTQHNIYAVVGNDKEKSDKLYGIGHDGFMNAIRRFVKGDDGQIYDVTMKIKDNNKEIAQFNYISTHDGFTLMDSVSYEQRHNEANGEDNRDGRADNYSCNCGVEGNTKKRKVIGLRRKLIKNEILMQMISQGTPVIMSGDEMGRTCQGNNNPYCQDNDINYVDWSLLKKNSDIYEFTRYMIGFRKQHKILHMSEPVRMSDYNSKGCPDMSFHGVSPWKIEYDTGDKCFAVLYNVAYGDENRDGKIYIMFNMHCEDKKFNLPIVTNGKHWEKIFTTETYSDCDTEDKNSIEERNTNKNIVMEDKEYIVPPRTVAVIHEV